MCNPYIPGRNGLTKNYADIRVPPYLAREFSKTSIGLPITYTSG